MSFTYRLKDDGKTMEVEDPIYGKIEIQPPYSEIILTKEMQRLNDITQNGFSVFDYPGLKNNERLSHSVGAFYLMSQMIEHLEKELKRYDIFISKDDKDMALCSMLLHDIGHGPFSHTCERITKYSHEKRTTDILLGDTEVNHLLKSTFGTKKLKKIASYIAEIDDKEDEGKTNKSSFTNLLKSLISHQLDADRLDYLVRDSYHAGIPSGIDYKKLIQTLGISVDNNQEYELLVDKKGLSSIETILIERFQKYRDVYFTKSSVLSETIFSKILEIYRENPETVDAELPEAFKKLALNPTNLSLDDFLDMTDSAFLQSFDIMKEKSKNPVLKYLCDMPRALDDFQNLENNIDVETVKQKLKDIFGDRDFSDTMSIISNKFKVKLYKKEESLRINYGNLHKDLTEATPHLIRPEEYLEKSEVAFNPEILRLELGMTEKEFKPYKEELKAMVNELNKKPEEFELKYIINQDQQLSQDNILNALLSNGFKIIKIKNKQNNDEYFDTKALSLLARGGSLRMRKLTQDGKQRYKATYKMPTAVGEVYSSREEIELDLDTPSIKELKQKMQEKKIDVELEDVLPSSLINSVTERRDYILEKNGVQVCLSFDNTKYANHVLNGQTAEDSMVEIEALGNVADRVMLNEINSILQSSFPELQTNKQSKYERGMKRTREKYKKMENERNKKSKTQEEPVNPASHDTPEIPEDIEL